MGCLRLSNLGKARAEGESQASVLQPWLHAGSSGTLEGCRHPGPTLQESNLMGRRCSLEAGELCRDSRVPSRWGTHNG